MSTPESKKAAVHHMMELLQGVSVARALEGNDGSEDGRRPVVVLKTTDTIGHALKVLAENNIQSAPVQDPEREGYQGFVDSLDLVVAVLREVTGVHQDQDLHQVAWSSYAQTIAELDDVGHRAMQKKIGGLVNLSGADEFRTVSEHSTLAQCVEIFAAGRHRVAVEDESGRLVGVCSQSDVLRVLSQGMGSLGALVRDRVNELGLVSQAVVTVSARAPAIHAFFAMFFGKVTAVAVVDADGHLVGNLSASDVKGLRASGLGALLLPAADFVAATGGQRRVPLTCRPATRFGTVVYRLGSLRLHRLWACDDDEKPVGVVSTSDVCRFVASGAEGDLA